MTLKVTDRLTPSAERHVQHSPFWANVHTYFDRVYQMMGLDPVWFQALSTPKRVLTVSCPVNGATGTRDVFLRFAGGSGFLFNVNWWQFTA